MTVASKLNYRDREYIVPLLSFVKTDIYKYFYFDTLFFFLDDQTVYLEKKYTDTGWLVDIVTR